MSDPHTPRLVMSEVVGHLDLLEEEGFVVLEDEGSFVRARLGGQPGD